MSLPNIHHPTEYNRLIERLSGLKEDMKPRWGKMNPAQVCLHLYESNRAAMGETTVSMKGNLVLQWIGRTFFLTARPWPKSLPTASEFIVQCEPGEFERNRDLLIESLERAVQKGKTDEPWGVSPVFGKLTPQRWGEAIYKHVDHHLRQYGL